MKSNKTQESQEGTWMIKTGEDGNGLHLGKIEKRRPTFFSNLQYVSLYMYQNVINTQLKNHSQLLYGHDFANERLGLPI